MDVQKKKKSRLMQMFRTIPRLVDRFFFWFGGFIADHTAWFIAIPLLISFVLAPGITQLSRMTDDTKIWPLSGSLSINSPEAKDRFSALDSICTCVQCDDYGKNCNKTFDCGDETPDLCNGADSGLEPSCPHLQLMFVAKRDLSVTDNAIVQAMMAIDLNITFGHMIISKFKPRFFSSNVSEWQLCQTKPDGSCIQYSVITGLRNELKGLPGFKTVKEQNDFFMSLQDPENQKQLEEMMPSDRDTYYPFDSNKPNAAFSGPIFGDVELANPQKNWRNGYKASKVKRIGAMQMFYCLNESESMFDLNMKWSRSVLKWLEEDYDYHENFTLTVSSSWSRADRSQEEVQRLLPYLIICLVCLMVFCGMTTIRGHPAHRTLPWIGPIGVLTSVLGVGSAFGLVGWMGQEIVDLCFAIPLLILAVGIDDVFVYTENWRSTKPEWAVRKRLAVTMKRACPGIVVTSFMNSLAFIIDTQSPFYALQVFSNVSVLSALFDFVFQMTFFPAALAKLGEIDRKGHNALCCCAKLKPRTNANYRQDDFCYLICCTAPRSTLIRHDPNDKATKKENDSVSKEMAKKKAKGEYSARSSQGKRSQQFFRDIYAPFLLKPSVSLVAMVAYIGYIVVCAVLASRLHVGLRMENMAPDKKSGELNEVEVYFKYFREFSFPIDVILEGTGIRYWDPEVQHEISELYTDLTSLPGIGTAVIGRNWLDDYVKYANSVSLDISSEGSFLYFLRWFNESSSFLFQKKGRQDMLMDIRFADETMADYHSYTVEIENRRIPKILSSRLFVYAVDVADISGSGEVVNDLRNIKRKYEDKHMFNFSFYSREFVETEPMLATGYIVVYNTLIQLGAILTVTLLMMPHPVALFWIAVVLGSITFGVISITCAWNVDFDQVAMVNIMLTMGYCVDFSAHMTRTYVASKSKTRYEKTRDALGEFGFAIAQSSIAAIMAVLCLGSSYSYILRVGFQFFFVGILLSVFHTLVVFPVFLTYLGPHPLQQLKGRRRVRVRRRPKDPIDIDRHQAASVFDQTEDHGVRDSSSGAFRRYRIRDTDKALDTSLSVISDVTLASGPMKRSQVPSLSHLPTVLEFMGSEVSDTQSISTWKQSQLDATDTMTVTNFLDKYSS